MSWSESTLCREIEAERLAAEALKAKAFHQEHVQIVRKWRKHGMRVKLPKMSCEDDKPPKEGTQLWHIMLKFGENGTSTRFVAQMMGIDHALVVSAVSKLRVRGMLMQRSSTQKMYYSFSWTAAGTRYVQSLKQQGRLP